MASTFFCVPLSLAEISGECNGETREKSRVALGDHEGLGRTLQRGLGVAHAPWARGLGEEGPQGR